MIILKITRFEDIPLFTREGSWQVDYDLPNFVSSIEDLVENYGLQLNPDFQRGHVWSEEQQIKWLEFLLRGGRTSRVIYLNKPDWNLSVPEGAYNDFVCVDGLQRTTAIFNFIKGKIPVFGSYFYEYEDKIRFSIGSIKVNINDLKSKKEVLQWYVDMNAGGTPHTCEEIERVRKMIEKIK